VIHPATGRNLNRGVAGDSGQPCGLATRDSIPMEIRILTPRFDPAAQSRGSAETIQYYFQQKMDKAGKHTLKRDSDSPESEMIGRPSTRNTGLDTAIMNRAKRKRVWQYSRN